MPAEGGARVAIVEGAERMNEDAQSALLKTLEEPPPGVTIVLCADQEDRLLPTVRSRCFRVRLGLVGARDIEAIVADHGLADPPTAARLGRLAGGRPGPRPGLRPRPGGGPHPRRARAGRPRPDRHAARRPAWRPLAPRSRGPSPFARPWRRRTRPRPRPGPAVDAGRRRPAVVAAGTGRSQRRRRISPTTPTATTPAPAKPLPAAERRRGVELLLGLWADVARDLVLVGTGGGRSVHDTVLLDEAAAVAAVIDAAAPRPPSSSAPPARPSCSPRTSRRSSSSTRWRWPGRGASSRPDGRPRGSAGRRSGPPRCHRDRPGPGRRLPLLRPARGDGPRARRLGREHAGRLGPLRRRGSARPPGGPPRPARGGPRLGRSSSASASAWMPATGTLGPFAVRSGAHRGD